MNFDDNSPDQTTPCLIIGFGNTLRRDDGVGVEVARRLARVLDPTLARVIEVHQLMPELADDIAGASHVTFIDARIDGVPGNIMHRQLAPAQHDDSALGHHVSPEVLLALAASIYQANPTVELYTIVGQDFNHGSGFSAPVREAVHRLFEILRGRYAADSEHRRSGGDLDT